MSKFLLIETSTRNCSVALADDDRIVASKDMAPDRYSHAEKLHPCMEELLYSTGWHPGDLDAVAVGKGPGSYTGLRIGVSAAKGLAYALDIPLLSAGSLEILARGVKATEGFIVPMIDARRMEAYTAVFDHRYWPVREIKAEILDEQSFREFLERGPVYFAGDATDKAREVIRHPRAVFTSHRYPRAADMLPLVLEKWEKREFEDIAYFEPFYLKEFIAKKKKNIFGT
ncbi:MAG: tRNA (adenosine(37)-N6)-threonylcarbamoyltransferase complex dimerization subunit type 1 TsaB [Chlorobi bacterium]|nr:tRNA (adenosine(37)-N6)-threonylcarbamoyltransferase complex dimerization subunit type 1 TsaB [Chlorobiota bacterium]